MKYQPELHWQERDLRKVLDKAGALCPSGGVTTQQHRRNSSHSPLTQIYFHFLRTVYTLTWTLMWFLDEYNSPILCLPVQCKALYVTN